MPCHVEPFGGAGERVRGWRVGKISRFARNDAGARDGEGAGDGLDFASCLVVGAGRMWDDSQALVVPYVAVED